MKGVCNDLNGLVTILGHVYESFIILGCKVENSLCICTCIVLASLMAGLFPFKCQMVCFVYESHIGSHIAQLVAVAFSL